MSYVQYKQVDFSDPPPPHTHFNKGAKQNQFIVLKISAINFQFQINTFSSGQINVFPISLTTFTDGVENYTKNKKGRSSTHRDTYPGVV